MSRKDADAKKHQPGENHMVTKKPIDLSERCMVGRLSIGVVQTRKFDAEITQDFLDSKNADPDAARVNKLLLNGVAVKDINQCARAAREFFNARTCPWRFEGQGIFLAADVEELITKMDEYQEQFERLVDKFVDDYPTEIENAKKRLRGGLFKIEDFPPPERVREKFMFHFELEPAPSRMSLPTFDDKELNERVQELVTEGADKMLSYAQDEAWHRVYGRVKHLVEQLRNIDAEKSKRLYESSLTNIKDLVELLPHLNLIGDPKLTKLGKDIDKRLLVFTRDDLKENPDARRTTIEEADKMLAQIGQVIQLPQDEDDE
jgi:hypothetical protein